MHNAECRIAVDTELVATPAEWKLKLPMVAKINMVLRTKIAQRWRAKIK
jgi:hypothetical protein